MRRLLFAAALLALGTPATAGATGSEPAVTARPASFELFGTRFCSGTAEGCDVVFAEQPRLDAALESASTVRTDGQHRISVFGLSFCLEARETGPACEVSWALPPPAAAWRDQPEIRLLAEMARVRALR